MTRTFRYWPTFFVNVGAIAAMGIVAVLRYVEVRPTTDTALLIAIWSLGVGYIARQRVVLGPVFVAVYNTLHPREFPLEDVAGFIVDYKPRRHGRIFLRLNNGGLVPAASLVAFRWTSKPGFLRLSALALEMNEALEKIRHAHDGER